MTDSNILLRVDNNVTYIDGRLDKKVYQELKHILGYLPEDYFWRTKANVSNNKNQKWRQNWDGRISTLCWNQAKCKCNVKKSGTHFPTGLVSKSIEIFRKHSINYVIKDIRNNVEKKHNYSMSEEFEYRDYQKEAIEKSLNVDRGIIKCATGGGKNAIAAGFISERGVSPTIFYVPSIDLLRQSKDEIERFVKYSGSSVEVGEISGVKKEIKDITVMTIQTAVRALGGVWKKCDDEDISKDETNIEDMKEDIKDLVKSAKLMICDEVQHWASETCQIISDNSFSCKYKVAMSATPYRDKGDDILIQGCFGKTIIDINASYLIKRGYLIKPNIYFLPISNKRGMKKTSYPNVYKEALVENNERNEKIAKMAIEMRKQGRNILILCRQISHGNILEALIDNSIFLHGSHSGKKRKEHLDKMREGEPGVTIASVIFDEGVDCPALDSLILAGGGKSSTRALQRVGRTLRPFSGKEDAIVIDFMDRCKYLEEHSKRRLNIYRTEPEFVISETL